MQQSYIHLAYFPQPSFSGIHCTNLQSKQDLHVSISASLQMMTLVIYAIKVKDSINRITKTFYSTESCSVSWSFGLTLISIVMTTISAILAFSEIKKFAKEKNNDNIQANNTVNGVESQSGV